MKPLPKFDILEKQPRDNAVLTMRVILSIVALGLISTLTGMLFKLPIKSSSALITMSSDDRMTYLEDQETSTVVAYYCDLAPSNLDIGEDIQRSLKAHHGGLEISCGEGQLRNLAD